ncbi:MAG: PSD1 and planctomycete cytochrome C domain-containing protein, partial [Planctomycetaceae bacterium]
MPRKYVFICCVLSFVSTTRADEKPDFFEKKIRPVLVEHCYQCHSADSKSLKGGLRLDTAELTRAGGQSGPGVVPRKPGESLLLSALEYDSFEMPPSGKLSKDVIDDFRKWINNGAHDPRVRSAEKMEAAGVDFEAGRKFWAFQPPQKARSIGDDVVGSERIDLLVERRLASAKLAPNSEADRRTLFRRLSFDLQGLPPSSAEVDAFVAGASIEETVDRLLASKAYGQRWARLWLDVARFAEDQAHIVGNNKALFYPNAYIFRDWVIDALNSDMPYDEFVKLQLAADLIEPKSEENLPALGFIGLGPKYYRRGSLEVMAEEWEDRVDVVSRGLQGLTVACARCHDHKYDPIATEDYYALAGVFASTDMFNRPLKALRKKPQPSGKASKKKNNKVAPDETVHVIRDSKPRDLKVMIRGKVDNQGDTVPRGFLQVMFPGSRRAFKQGSGRRELAEAIVDRENPLTARVIVTRVWKEYFGRGLVGTPSNFGELGERPTHPELLDDLAVRFMQNGWSLKWLHRQIVMSKTYQRSSDVGPAVESDPANKLLWRVPRRKLSVEAWRDAV